MLSEYFMLSEIKGAAIFNNLGPILSEPVALVRLMFLGNFSPFSCEIFGIEK